MDFVTLSGARLRGPRLFGMAAALAGVLALVLINWPGGASAALGALLATDSATVESAPIARRLMAILEERGWRGWTRIERVPAAQPRTPGPLG